MKTVIFHHNDPDGWCSAAIVAGSFPPGTEMIFHEMNYGMKFPWSEINQDDKVFMVDFSLSPEDMIKLQMSVLTEFIWIDHHKSALAANAGYPFRGLQRDGYAACELCWTYFNQDLPMPDNVRLIGRYDVWDKRAWPEVLYAMYAVKALPGFNEPGCRTWEDILTGKIDLVSIGAPIARYQDGVNIEICKRASFVTELRPDALQASYRAIACNSPLCNSMLFDSVWDTEKHDIMLSFFIGSNGMYTVSVYSTKPEIDCSAIAKAFGGGGHKGAAGFQCIHLPFEIKK